MQCHHHLTKEISFLKIIARIDSDLIYHQNVIYENEYQDSKSQKDIESQIFFENKGQY
ncbi:unnamed protein product [Paramecium sonneborni]|uniref:Uncharacterized protein n=1 Tax=Paramecium sonneborni TaxID=65129 RepID=A0A8S1QXR7_9CILI|nr:unnamed protein product [Paramecium sonneborni]